MLRSYKSIVALLLGCALACGRAATHVDGSVNGIHLDAKDSAAERFTIASGTPGQFQRGVAIRIDSAPAVCTRMQQGRPTSADNPYLFLVVVGIPGSSDDVFTGPHDVVLKDQSFDVRGASAAFVAHDSVCVDRTAGYVAAGQIFIESISATTVKGDFNLYFINGGSVDHLTGAFEAPVCTDTKPSDPICQT